MRSHRRNSSKNLRIEIAQYAARMIAEGSARNFAEAKQKAAASLGLENFRNMPENIAVHTALMEYQRIFEGDEVVRRIESMRRGALSAMKLLRAFTPRLAGPVLYGSACDYSPVTIHLHSDEVEAVTRFFHDHDIAYRLGATQLNTGARNRREFPVHHVVNDDIHYEFIVLPTVFIAHPPISSLDKRPYRRADMAALEQLIATGTSP